MIVSYLNFKAVNVKPEKRKDFFLPSAVIKKSQIEFEGSCVFTAYKSIKF